MNKIYRLILTIILVVIAILPNFSVSATTLQDYTTFTETDSGSKITITSTTITLSGVVQSNNASVLKDMGIGYYSEDFELRQHFHFTSKTAVGFTDYWNMLGVSSNNTQGTREIEVSGGSMMIGLGFDGNQFRGRQWNSAGGVTETATTLAGIAGSDYYLKVFREIATSTIGFVIYSDSSYTTQLWASNISDSYKYPYRYLVPFYGQVYAGQTGTLTGTLTGLYDYFTPTQTTVITGDYTRQGSTQNYLVSGTVHAGSTNVTSWGFYYSNNPSNITSSNFSYSGNYANTIFQFAHNFLLSSPNQAFYYQVFAKDYIGNIYTGSMNSIVPVNFAIKILTVDVSPDGAHRYAMTSAILVQKSLMNYPLIGMIGQNVTVTSNITSVINDGYEISIIKTNESDTQAFYTANSPYVLSENTTFYFQAQSLLPDGSIIYSNIFPFITEARFVGGSTPLVTIIALKDITDDGFTVIGQVLSDRLSPVYQVGFDLSANVTANYMALAPTIFHYNANLSNNGTFQTTLSGFSNLSWFNVNTDLLYVQAWAKNYFGTGVSLPPVAFILSSATPNTPDVPSNIPTDFSDIMRQHMRSLNLDNPTGHWVYMFLWIAVISFIFGGTVIYLIHMDEQFLAKIVGGIWIFIVAVITGIFTWSGLLGWWPIVITIIAAIAGIGLLISIFSNKGSVA